MQRKSHGGGEEGGGHSVGLWYVSFADMITLLLSFFVMLATFSSFSKESLDQFAGVWAYISNYSILPGRNVTQDSMSPQTKHMDWTAAGSEKRPAHHSLDPTVNPRDMAYLVEMAQAYNDRRVLYIPSRRLFWGQGASLMPAGAEHLDLIAKYVDLVPCQVIVSESNLPLDAEGTEARGLSRAWEIVRRCTARGQISLDRFSLEVGDSAAARQMGESVVQLTLMARSVTK